MLLEIKCHVQGTVIVEATFPYYFEKTHRPFTDENQKFSYISGVIAEGVCITITNSYNEHGKECIVLDSETFENISESPVKEFYHPYHQSTREIFSICVQNAKRWFGGQERYLNALNYLPS